MATPPRPSPGTPGERPIPEISTRRTDRAADAIWRRLSKGLSESWLDEIRGLRTDQDGFEATLDIWSVALTVELKDPNRREAASLVLTRLHELSEEVETRS